jgi:hypothetical protein
MKRQSMYALVLPPEKLMQLGSESLNKFTLFHLPPDPVASTPNLMIGGVRLALLSPDALI